MLDFVDRDVYGSNFMRAEIVNHENLGVPREVFAAFYTTMRDTFVGLLGAAWTNDIDAAWNELLARIDAALARQMRQFHAQYSDWSTLMRVLRSWRIRRTGVVATG